MKGNNPLIELLDHPGVRLVFDTDECVIWPGALNQNGYGYIRSRMRGEDKQASTAHRRIWELTNKASMLPGMVAMHSCDNRACINSRHISPGTFGDNSRDMVAKGRQNFSGLRPKKKVRP